MSSTPPIRNVLGIPINAMTMTDVLDHCERSIDLGTTLHIGVVNAAKIVRMRHDPLLRRAVIGSNIILADGQAVVWASKLLAAPLPERVAGIDLFENLLALADKRGFSVYFLGATQDVLESVLHRVNRERPRLRIAGARNGYFTEDEAPYVADDIRAAEADLLFVAMTSPKKEVFLDRWGPSLNVHVFHGVGGSFDVLAGKVRRAPRVWQTLGLEWFYRVLQEPRRMWRRYLVTNTVFVWLIIRELCSRAFRSPAATRTEDS